MKGQNTGVENEKELTKAFNGRQLAVLSAYQQAFIKQLNGNVKSSSVVKATKIGGQGFKPDIKIEVDGVNHYVSVKKGSGNSVHQEKTALFINYCKVELGMTDREAECLLLFLYGDGTIDGNSLPEERKEGDELLNNYKDEIKTVQSFLDKHKRSLIERFLIYGRLGREKNLKADYIYHGDAERGVWCPLNGETIDYLVEMSPTNDSPLSIGPLTLQVWNRNLNADPKFEDRRHSIQIKWGRCEQYIKKMNELYLLSLSKKKETNRTRALGNNIQGFENQNNLMNIMDGSRVSDLPNTVKNIVQGMFPSAAMSEVVHASKITEQFVKPRLSVMVNDDKKNLSISMGSGNSVHQETLEGFLAYCRNDLDITEQEEKAIKTIMYGDGTLDGDSLSKDRLKSTEEVKKKYSSQVRIAQGFFDRNKRSLIERFLIYGRAGKQKNVKSDYVYYGTDTIGRLVLYAKAIEYLMKKESSNNALLSLGSLTVQPWNRNPEAKPNLESRRHSIQVKWGGMRNDLATILENEDNNKGTFYGDWEEYELVSKLNREKNISNSLWLTICKNLNLDNIDDIYAVRVTNLVKSNLSERPVLSKADIYLVKGRIKHEVLLDNNYWLDEDVIAGLDVVALNGSGISCKRPQSKFFTYDKLSVNSFNKLFNDSVLGSGISLFVKESDLAFNNIVLEGWGVKEAELIDKYKETLISSGFNESDISLTNKEVCKIIKSESINEAKDYINNNKAVSEAIFYGKGLFEEPYTASFIYFGGGISVNYIPKFSITTGSGRHKGIFTIVIKPA